MKLVHKGIALALIPLLFELSLIATLAWQLNTLEKERQLAGQGRDMISLLTNWSRSMADAAIYLIVSRYHESPSEEKRFKDTLQAMEQQAKALAGSAEALPELKADIAALKARSDKLAAQLSYQLRPGDSLGGNTIFSSNLDMRNQLEPQIVQFIRDCDRLSNRVKTLTHAENPVSLENIWQWMAANGIGSLLISLVMVWFFFGSIARRILKITEDTKYFKTNRKLPPVQVNRGGQDEIYELEREFQDMARAVQEAGARREQFTSMISHDLRSPLAAINITLAMVQTGAYGNLNAVGQERINSAEKSIQRLLNLINQLLDTEKLEAGLFQLQISRVGLLSVVYPAVEALKQLADEKQIELSFRCQDYEVEVDLERMSQVVQNLLSNAIKFTPKWGKITLKSEETEDSYIVSVSDTGVGIKEEFLERIFDRFEQISEDDMPRQAIRQGQAKSRLSTADRLVGSGLGLSICKALVEAHGGEIGVHSLEGKGSTFWFSLPKLEPGKR